MIKELQKNIDKIMHEQNNQGLPDFEGYSPVEMQYILYDTFGKNSPIQLLNLTDLEYKSIPILNQVKYITGLIDKLGELKLTNKGFLPTKIVADIYKQGFLKDELIELGISKLYKETDSMTIHLTKVLLELSGIVKRRNNRLSLTKTGKKIISNNHQILLTIFKTFGLKFNWAYFDGYGENNIGQLGLGFSLILLSKYGGKRQIDRFYSKKYFQAFPELKNNLTDTKFRKGRSNDCYSLRTFDRFLDYFGLIKIEADKKLDSDKFITKTELYDKLIRSTPHNKS